MTGGSAPEINRFFFCKNGNPAQYVSNKRCAGAGFETDKIEIYANSHNTFMQVCIKVLTDVGGRSIIITSSY